MSPAVSSLPSFPNWPLADKEMFPSPGVLAGEWAGKLIPGSVVLKSIGESLEKRIQNPDFRPPVEISLIQ